jgi:predicted metal-binding protein
MAIVNGIGNILHAIISGIVAFFDIIISFLTCGYCGGRRRRSGGTHTGRRHHTTTTSRI